MGVRIAVFGDWHNAWVTAACLAPHHNVTLVTDTTRLDITEPGLDDLIEGSSKGGSFKRISREELREGDWSFDYGWIAHDTLVDDSDRVIVEDVRQTAKLAALYASRGLIVSSQVPLGTCARLEDETRKPVAYVPENMRLGRGIDTFYKPGGRIVGARLANYARHVAELLSPIEYPVYNENIEPRITNLQTAEMVKHARNAFLATSISLANELAAIGKANGADPYVVAAAMKSDQRIGRNAYVTPGMGFAGGTLPRDLRVLQELAHAVDIPSRVVDSVLEANRDVYREIARTIRKQERGPLLLLGYSYKADVETLRRSPANDLLQWLPRDQPIYGFDPKISSLKTMPLGWDVKCLEALPPPEPVTAAIVLTARPEFRSINWRGIPCKLVLDTCDGAVGADVASTGIPYRRLWQPQ